ncbi:MAG: glutamate-1-semialdehyde-2,1-aminomutase [Chloroflexota bacterium]|nr:MAG: glutamate-1-semialdehyde-2,1-aminomutase [Chloroflexota bacterium]
MDRSSALFEAAKLLIPGGVNSPVRAHRAVGGSPPFIARGDGPWIWDVDGNRYLDLVCSWGPLILGHRPAQVLAALQAQLERGWTFGAPTEGELRLATAVSERMPAVEMLRLVNSGTEAAMSAVRLARAMTGRSKLIKFAGGYHGHADALLVEAGSGVATLGIPGTPGITAGAAGDTLVARFNALAEVEATMAQWPGQIAAVIVEPVAGNMGVVPPGPGFLEGLRRLTRDDGSLLIFDEVITGFRVARGGAQERFGVTPDLTCLGKALGGGLPIGAYGGRRAIMEQVAPAGPVYQAGTLSGNPLAVAAGLATLEALDDSAYRQLEEAGARVARMVQSAADAAGIPLIINRVGSMLTAFFTDRAVVDYASARRANTASFASWFRRLLANGVSLPPSQFEAAFVSTAHDDEALAFLERSLTDSFTGIRPAPVPG